MSYPTPSIFIAFLDANPTRYKNTPEADGYNSTQDIANEITDRKMIPNPTPQGDVPKPLTITDLQALISEDSIGRLSDSWWNQMRVNLSGETSENGITGTREDAVAQVNVAFERNNITERLIQLFLIQIGSLKYKILQML
jgi:hypothetical protein